jgi:hypothetical protein
MSMKNCNDTIGNRTGDLPIYSAVPQPSAPSAACPAIDKDGQKLKENKGLKNHKMVTNMARQAVSEYRQKDGNNDQETRKAAVFWCATPCSLVQILTVFSNAIIVKATLFS